LNTPYIICFTDKEEFRDNLTLGRKRDREQFEPFIGKNVTVETAAKNILEGKIVECDKGLIFMQKRQRTRGKLLTAGLFDGFYATLTVRRIKETC
jgi:hypothetical protein